MDELKDAYFEVKDSFPDDRTIYRNIRRINELFNPYAYTAGSQKTKPGKKKVRSNATNPKALTISSKRDSAGVTRYLYTGKKLVNKYDTNQVLLIILGLYSQQRSILKDHFEKVMSSIMADVLHRYKDGESFFAEIEEHIHVSGQGTVDSKKVLRKISEIIRAIDDCKVVKIDYVRTYDGERRTRQVEPYGLVCRYGNWYLYGYCREHKKNRIYLLDQIQRLKVLEGIMFKRSAAFKMKDVFSLTWGIMVLDDAQKAKAETVRLRVKKGVAERFKAVSFHDTQQVKSLPHDEVEVSFKIAGADEMIPWLVSWGGTMEVLEPKWLKDQLLKYIQEIANVYK